MLRRARAVFAGLTLAALAAAAAAEPPKILFVGNSFTYTRPPALQYNVANVTDLNLQNSNPNANPQARIYLYQTWARPDLTYPAGSPYAGELLETMTEDLRRAYAQAAVNNSGVAGVVPGGEAFMRAVQAGVAVRDPYQPDPGLMDLWWFEDQFHPSVHGAYSSALTMLGAITGIDPSLFGANEKAASDLGLSPLQAMQLQRVAADQLRTAGHAVERRNCLHAAPHSNGSLACLP